MIETCTGPESPDDGDCRVHKLLSAKIGKLPQSYQ